jgi:hypothetical protein
LSQPWSTCCATKARRSGSTALRRGTRDPFPGPPRCACSTRSRTG